MAQTPESELDLNLQLVGELVVILGCCAEVHVLAWIALNVF